MRKVWNWTVYRVDQALGKIKSVVLATLWYAAYGFRAALVLSGALVVGRVVYDALSQVCPQILVTLFCAYVVLSVWDWADGATDRVMSWLDGRLEPIRDILPEVDHD